MKIPRSRQPVQPKKAARLQPVQALAAQRPHPESLLRVPLVAQLLADPGIQLVPNAIDRNWAYKNLVPLSMTGFNPLQGAIYYGARSAFATWLKSPDRSARDANEGDVLIHEVFFAVHDYLHGWATLAIQSLAPRLGYGTAPILEKNIEDFVFCHLLTEAVATAGLDYWYLCTIDLNEVCDLGTRFRALSVGYDEKHLREYRRFSPGFNAQQSGFLARLTRFYCTGVFEGFDIRSLKQSPLIQGWLEHELGYGVKQRETIRSWLSYLSGDTVRFTRGQLGAPVGVSGKWKIQLTRMLGELLWDKVKNSNLHAFPRTVDPAGLWRRRDLSRKDFRFLNAGSFRHEDLSGAFSGEAGEESFQHFFHQFVSSHGFREFDPGLIRLFPELLRSRDPGRLATAFKDQKRLRPTPQVPVDLLTLN